LKYELLSAILSPAKVKAFDDPGVKVSCPGQKRHRRSHARIYLRLTLRASAWAGVSAFADGDQNRHEEEPAGTGPWTAALPVGGKRGSQANDGRAGGRRRSGDALVAVMEPADLRNRRDPAL
jgi:hypothetical protein